MTRTNIKWVAQVTHPLKVVSKYFWNLSKFVCKTFAIYDRLNLNFRADVFNAFNHTRWTNVCNTEPFCYDNSGNQVNFGTVSAGREGRIMQMGAKLQFQPRPS